MVVLDVSCTVCGDIVSVATVVAVVVVNFSFAMSPSGVVVLLDCVLCFREVTVVARLNNKPNSEGLVVVDTVWVVDEVVDSTSLVESDGEVVFGSMNELVMGIAVFVDFDTLSDDNSVGKDCAVLVLAVEAVIVVVVFVVAIKVVFLVSVVVVLSGLVKKLGNVTLVVSLSCVVLSKPFVIIWELLWFDMLLSRFVVALDGLVKKLGNVTRVVGFVIVVEEDDILLVVVISGVVSDVEVEFVLTFSVGLIVFVVLRILVVTGEMVGAVDSMVVVAIDEIVVVIGVNAGLNPNRVKGLNGAL